ncbi:MAG: L-aspartate oxidase [Acidobacteria bacterium]|nr:L-aspartate oxidase [Acidobacteriota bacterium]
MANGSKREKIEADFLIIGSGLAGLYAALCAARHGEVVLITKSTFQESNSFQAQGGIAAAISPEDSPELHLEDTQRAGRDLCNRKAVEILTREAPQAIKDLEAWGVSFDRNEAGSLDLGQEGGHSRRRILHAGGSATGESLVRALSRRVLDSPRIRLFEHAAATELIAEEGRCLGALAYHRNERTSRILLAPATVLATGGAAALYQRTTNPPTATGEGIALAYRAGAAVMDMEFMQFHPTALYQQGKRSFLISESVRGEGAYLLNPAGHRFMPDYHELAELAPRDVVAAAIHHEMKKAGAECVFLHVTHLEADFVKQRFSNIYETCLEQGIDITRQRIPVAPAAHYTIGGVRTDLEGKTSLEGLWACGEVACTGVHGANRLASNSLLECVVFARRAMAAAAGSSAPPGRVPTPEGSGRSPWEDQPREWEPLARLLTEQVGLVRNRAGLSQALKNFEELVKNQDETASEWHDRLLVASLMAKAALLREESRGVHLREDFPAQEQSWQKHIVFQRGREPEFACD